MHYHAERGNEIYSSARDYGGASARCTRSILLFPCSAWEQVPAVLFNRNGDFLALVPTLCVVMHMLTHSMGASANCTRSILLFPCSAWEQVPAALLNCNGDFIELVPTLCVVMHMLTHSMVTRCILKLNS